MSPCKTLTLLFEMSTVKLSVDGQMGLQCTFALLWERLKRS